MDLSALNVLNAAVAAGSNVAMFGDGGLLGSPTNNNNNSDTVQAVLAALRSGDFMGSPANGTGIPSQTSAFALLRNSAAENRNGANTTTASSNLLPNEQQQLFSAANLPFASTYSTNPLLQQQQQTHNHHHQQPHQQQLGAMLAASKTHGNASNNDPSAMALKMLADSNLNGIFSKIQQHLPDLQGKESAMPFFLSAPTQPNSKLDDINNYQQHQEHQSTQQFLNFDQKANLNIRAMLEPHINSLNRIGAPASAMTSLENNTDHAYNDRASTVPAQSPLTSPKDASSDGTPVRRIRRRRPKSPRQIKSMSLANGTKSIEQQPLTPDDPIIRSPPSITRPSMPIDSVEMDNDFKHRHKECLVCGDHATGYNFNVITCESCKAFFRRNALRPKDFKCPYNDECLITQVTRRFCQKCRLRKCFMVGMKKEWILNDDQLKRRKNSRLNNKSSASSGHPSQCTTPNSQHGVNGHLMSPASAGGSTAKASTSIARTNVFFPPPRHASVDISPPSMSVGSGISLSPETPTNLPPLSHGEDHYNPNILRQSTNDSAVFPPMSQAINSALNIGNPGVAAGTASNTISTTPPMTAAAINGAYSTTLPSPNEPVLNGLKLSESSNMSNLLFSSSIETLLRRSEVTISLEQYQRFKSMENQQQQQQRQQQKMSSAQLPMLPTGRIDSTIASPSAGNIAVSTAPTALNTIHNSLQQNFLAAIGLTTTQNQQQPSIDQNYPNNAVLPFIVPSEYGMTTTPATTAIAAAASTHSSMMAGPVATVPTPAADCDVLAAGTKRKNSSSLDFSNLNDKSVLNSESFKKMAKTFMDYRLRDQHNMSTSQIAVMEPKNSTFQDIVMEDHYRLSSYEKAEIDMVRQAFHHMDLAISSEIGPISGPGDYLRLIDISMRRIVKATKELKTFYEISADGRLQLLRGAMVALLALRGASFFNKDQTHFNSPVVGVVSTMALKFLNNAEYIAHFFSCGRMIHESIRTNRMAMYLLSSFILFDHYKVLSDPLDQQTSVRYRDHYQNLLKRYIESIYGLKARKILENVQEVLPLIYSVAENAATAFCGVVKKSETLQLPAEFFKITDILPEENSQLQPKGDQSSADEPVNVVEPFDNSFNNNESVNVVDDMDDAYSPPSIRPSSPPAVTLSENVSVITTLSVEETKP